jgi:hypothetical protein
LELQRNRCNEGWPICLVYLLFSTVKSKIERLKASVSDIDTNMYYRCEIYVTWLSLTIYTNLLTERTQVPPDSAVLQQSYDCP